MVTSRSLNQLLTPPMANMPTGGSFWYATEINGNYWSGNRGFRVNSM